VTTPHDVPFQRSIKVADPADPTAHTFAAALPSTAFRAALPVTAGVATDDQAVPFHRAARATMGEFQAAWLDPTAQPSVVLSTSAPMNRLSMVAGFGVVATVQVAASAGPAGTTTATTASTTAPTETMVRAIARRGRVRPTASAQLDMYINAPPRPAHPVDRQHVRRNATAEAGRTGSTRCGAADPGRVYAPAAFTDEAERHDSLMEIDAWNREP
jgi:hypothetical protein